MSLGELRAHWKRDSAIAAHITSASRGLTTLAADVGRSINKKGGLCPTDQDW